jgi:hypothetical protein
MSYTICRSGRLRRTFPAIIIQHPIAGLWEARILIQDNIGIFDYRA